MITVTRAEGITKDNDYYYLDSIRAYVAAADGHATLSLYKSAGEVRVFIKPSKEEFKQEIIDGLLAINRLLGIKIIFSKSLKISRTISFSVAL